jgi:hypothetical protein
VEVPTRARVAGRSQQPDHGDGLPYVLRSQGTRGFQRSRHYQARLGSGGRGVGSEDANRGKSRSLPLALPSRARMGCCSWRQEQGDWLSSVRRATGSPWLQRPRHHQPRVGIAGRRLGSADRDRRKQQEAGLVLRPRAPMASSCLTQSRGFGMPGLCQQGSTAWLQRPRHDRPATGGRG